MAKEETIGFVGLSTEELASLDGIPCHVYGIIMVRKENKENSDHLVHSPDMVWACTSCGATTGCTEVKDGEK